LGLKIPGFTRIIVITGDDSPVREYGISRPMIVSLVCLFVIFIACLGVVLYTYTTQIGALHEAQQLRDQLAAAQARVATVVELNQELEKSRALQERILQMLGVEPMDAGSEDYLAPWSGAPDEPDDGDDGPGSLQRAADAAISPPPSTWPAAGVVTREFIVGEPHRGIVPHQGLDIAGATDSPIVAAGPGVVSHAQWDDFLGNFVEIRHGLGYVTVYGHCNRLAVQKGDRTASGQVIAYLGDTGQASAPHLHFEVWRDGEAIDPRQVMQGQPRTQ